MQEGRKTPPHSSSVHIGEPKREVFVWAKKGTMAARQLELPS
jgi:hypothetical protein